MSCIAQALSAFVAVLCFATPGNAAYTVEPRGTWPNSWPVELEALRPQSRTLVGGALSHAAIYQISFADRDQFERAWPAICKVRTPGSPLTLRGVDALDRWPMSDAETKPSMQIHAPLEGFDIATDPISKTDVGTKDHLSLQKLLDRGLALPSGPPWPKDMISDHGELPEYAQSEARDGKMRWVAADTPRDSLQWMKARVAAGQSPRLFRARVDIELVVDGEIVDLNRIQFPPDAKIIDRRFENKADKR